MKAITLVCLLAAVAGPALVVSQAPAPGGISDDDILNFALQLEYLEGEFYSCAASGQPLPDEVRGGGPPSTGCTKAQLSAPAQAYADEIASDELAHVRLLRAALGSQATPIPQIDIGPAFAAAADAAFGGQTLSPAFSPYLNDVFFYLGAFIFEDVGVTAYSGAAALISSKQILSTAAQILSTESYHGGLLRTLLAQQRDGETPYNVTVGDVANAITELRSTLSEQGGNGGDEVPLVDDNSNTANVVPADSQGLTYQRTPTQVLDIVTAGGGPTGGGFFPNGINGAIGGSASSS